MHETESENDNFMGTDVSRRYALWINEHIGITSTHKSETVL